MTLRNTSSSKRLNKPRVRIPLSRAGIFCLVGKNLDRIIILFRKKPYGGNLSGKQYFIEKMSLPRGCSEHEDRTLLDTALREFREETNFINPLFVNEIAYELRWRDRNNLYRYQIFFAVMLGEPQEKENKRTLEISRENLHHTVRVMPLEHYLFLFRKYQSQCYDFHTYENLFRKITYFLNTNKNILLQFVNQFSGDFEKYKEHHCILNIYFDLQNRFHLYTNKFNWIKEAIC